MPKQENREFTDKAHDYLMQEQNPEIWTQKYVQQKFDELGFDFPNNEEQLRAFNEKFRNYPHKLTGREIDPIKIIESIKNQG